MLNKLACVALVVASALVGCADDGGPESCVAAAAHYSECTGTTLDGLCGESSSEARSEEILALSCEELSGGADGKGDGQLGWRGEDVRCSWNWQCEGELVCRPYSKFGDDWFCKPRGGELFEKYNGWCGAWCDDESDCRSGLVCVGASIIGNGMCITPDHEPSSTCNLGEDP